MSLFILKLAQTLTEYTTVLPPMLKVNLMLFKLNAHIHWQGKVSFTEVSRRPGASQLLGCCIWPKESAKVVLVVCYFSSARLLTGTRWKHKAAGRNWVFNFSNIISNKSIGQTCGAASLAGKFHKGQSSYPCKCCILAALHVCRHFDWVEIELVGTICFHLIPKTLPQLRYSPNQISWKTGCFLNPSTHATIPVNSCHPVFCHRKPGMGPWPNPNQGAVPISMLIEGYFEEECAG